MQLFLQTGLRHACLTLLCRERVDLMTLKELAAPGDINSTEIYAHVEKYIQDAILEGSTSDNS